jgi:ribonuclease BN (tRNA processing enzyme)
MGQLRLIPLGIGNAFSALYYSTSLALIAADCQWLLVDCPHPIRKILREACAATGVDLPLESLVGIVLSHLHADHASGLEGLGAYQKYIVDAPRLLDLFAVPAVLDALQQRPEAEYYNLHCISGVCGAGPFRLEARDVTHGDVPASAFRIGVAGRSIAHSGDATFDVELIRWLNGADLVIHEAGAESEPSTHHTAYRQLADLPIELRRKMRLIHCPDEFDCERSIIEPLRQWRVYSV